MSEASRTSPKNPAILANMDTVGAVTSLLCAVHCAVLPFVVTLLPLWGLSFLAGARVEWGLLLLASGIGVVSLGSGYRRHRSIRTLALLVGALALLFLGRFGEHLQWSLRPALLGVAGGLVLMTAHWLNYRLCRSCETCRQHHEASP